MRPKKSYLKFPDPIFRLGEKIGSGYETTYPVDNGGDGEEHHGRLLIHQSTVHELDDQVKLL